MKARGYGLKHRKPFSLYKYHTSDVVFTVLTLCLAAAAITFAGIGGLSMQFYPTILLPEATTMIVLCYISYGALALLPAALELMERIKWKLLMSGI